MNNIPIIRSIVEWVVNFIIDYVAPWIIERGGWVSLLYFTSASPCQITLFNCSVYVIFCFKASFSVYVFLVLYHLCKKITHQTMDEVILLY